MFNEPVSPLVPLWLVPHFVRTGLICFTSTTLCYNFANFHQRLNSNFLLYFPVTGVVVFSRGKRRSVSTWENKTLPSSVCEASLWVLHYKERKKLCIVLRKNWWWKTHCVLLLCGNWCFHIMSYVWGEWASENCGRECASVSQTTSHHRCEVCVFGGTCNILWCVSLLFCFQTHDTIE